jgi:hypothetical protein
MGKGSLAVAWDMPIASTIMILLVVLNAPLIALASGHMTVAGMSLFVWVLSAAQLVTRLWVLGRLWVLSLQGDGPNVPIAWSAAASVAAWLLALALTFVPAPGALKHLFGQLLPLVTAAGWMFLAVAFVRWRGFPDWLGWLTGVCALLHVAGAATVLGVTAANRYGLSIVPLALSWAGLTLVLLDRALLIHGMDTRARRVLFFSGWTGLALAVVFLVFGAVAWPPGGLLFALPYFLLLVSGVCALAGAALLVAAWAMPGRSARPQGD